MKKILVVATLSIAVAAVIKRITEVTERKPYFKESSDSFADLRIRHYSDQLNRKTHIQ